MDWRPFVYGGIASVTAEFATFPVDLTKTRLQVQGQTISGSQHKEIRYRGMFHALTRIPREEGARALYSGFSPAALRQATYGTTKIGIYWTLKRYFVENPQDETLALNVFCGLVAGVVGQSIFNPTDVLKVRMQAGSKSELRKQGLWRSFSHIYHNEGFPGLYRGVCPTALRAAVICGVELPAYDVSKRQLIQRCAMRDTVSTHFVASVIAGFAGALASTPIDVVKTRLMNQEKLKTSAAVLHTGVGGAGMAAAGVAEEQLALCGAYSEGRGSVGIVEGLRTKLDKTRPVEHHFFYNTRTAEQNVLENLRAGIGTSFSYALLENLQ